MTKPNAQDDRLLKVYEAFGEKHVQLIKDMRELEKRIVEFSRRDMSNKNHWGGTEQRRNQRLEIGRVAVRIVQCLTGLEG